jgi:hypothetical protein
MTPEQKARLEELQAKGDSLNETEKTELESLEALTPEPTEEEEFNAAWDEGDDDTGTDAGDPEGSKTNDDPVKGSKDGDASGKTTDGSDDASTADDGSPTPDGQSDGQDSDDDAGSEETPAEKIARLEAENMEKDQKMRSWNGRIKAANKRAEEAEAKARKKDSSNSDDAAPAENEDKELDEFFEEYPDLKRPIEKAAEKIANKIVDKRMAKVETTVETVVQSKQEDDNEKHIKEIEYAHKDWKTIYNSGALLKWIETQPKFLQSRYHDIVDKGNSEEVIAMFDQYKKATGKSKNETTKQTSQSDKEKRQKEMEAVESSSAGPIDDKKGPSKDDFDASWDHFEKADK